MPLRVLLPEVGTSKRAGRGLYAPLLDKEGLGVVVFKSDTVIFLSMSDVSPPFPDNWV